MRHLGLAILLISSLALPARADDRAVAQPVIINPSAPPAPVRAGSGNGPLVILVGDAAKQQQAAVAKALRHKRKARTRTFNMSIGAH